MEIHMSELNVSSRKLSVRLICYHLTNSEYESGAVHVSITFRVDLIVH